MTNLYKTVDFTTTKAGLSTVAYTIYNADGSTKQTRTGSGVYEVSPGLYGAIIPFATGQQGYYIFDTGESTPVTEAYSVNLVASVPGQPYQQFVVGDFGLGKQGLSTVGYALHNGLKKETSSRITTGVLDLGGGQYGVLVSIPAEYDDDSRAINFTGSVLFDSGETTPLFSNIEIQSQGDIPNIQGRPVMIVNGVTYAAGTPYVQHYSTNVYGDMNQVWYQLVAEMNYYEQILADVDMTQISKNYAVNMYVSKIEQVKRNLTNTLRIMQDLNPRMALARKNANLVKQKSQMPSDENRGY